jgi:mannose-6-phosphate isomerase-like protein (cupin superfamily)
MRAVVAALLCAAAVGGCQSRQRTPEAPPPPREPKLEALRRGGDPALQPLLDAYPLGDKPARVDLLGATRKRSTHLVQARKPLPRHYHPTRTETVHVLTGSGACYVGEKPYPITPGATFRIAPGVVHAAFPDEGSTIVAVSWFEPPLVDVDDRVYVDETK